MNCFCHWSIGDERCCIVVFGRRISVKLFVCGCGPGAVDSHVASQKAGLSL